MASKSARTTPEPRLSYIQLDLKSSPNNNKEATSVSTTTTTTKSESLKGGDKLEKIKLSTSTSASAVMTNGKQQLVNGKVRKGSGGSLTSSFTASSSAAVPSSSSSSVTTISTTIPVLKEHIMENGNSIRPDSKHSNVATSNSVSAVPAAPAAASVPYAQIDFAKTLALSNSAANHRKL